MTSLLSSVFLDPPRDAVAQYPTVAFVWTMILMIGSLIFGIIYTYRTRSPLYFWTAVAGASLYPFFVEPIGDWFVAVWWPTNHLQTGVAPFDRPMPWLAVFFYLAGIPMVSVITWELVKRGVSASRLLAFVTLITLLEVPMEMTASHFQWMVYFGNHATLLGVPIYCIPQNGGMFAPVAVVLAWLLPRTRGWRWVLVPFAVTVALLVFAAIATWPAYLAIHLQAGPVLGWTAGIIAFVLNAAVVVACAYAPPVKRIRAEVAARRQAAASTELAAAV